jgi:hypothetical protein
VIIGMSPRSSNFKSGNIMGYSNQRKDGFNVIVRLMTGLLLV